MRRLSDIISHLSYSVELLAAMLLSACAGNDAIETEEPLPDGMGRLQVTVTTRSVTEDPTKDPVHENPWETPDHEWEVMHSLRVIICRASDNTVVQIKEVADDKINNSIPDPIPGAVHNQTTDYIYGSPVEVISDPLPVGNYHIFATANYADGYQVGDVINLNRTEKFPFGLSLASDDYAGVAATAIPFGAKRNIPMTGKLMEGNDLKSVGVTASSIPTEAGTLTVWRVISKMQFEFANESAEPVEIYGIEVEPINLASEDGPGVYLFSKDDLTLTDNLEAGETHESGKYGVTLPPKGGNAKSAREDMGKVKYPAETPVTPLLTIPANSPAYVNNQLAHSIYFYLNETDATYTTTQNQLSLRFKIKRGSGSSKIEEIRYGVTTHHDLTDNDPYGGYKGGFNVIRRNDWIHIPVILTDWQFRIEPLAFVPIAGYPAKTLSSDALTATFKTGGMIALQPFIKKYDDSSWRNFDDPDITLVDIHWKNDDGTNVFGDNKIVKSAFAYDQYSKSIIGELNNKLPSSYTKSSYMTTFTVHVKLAYTSGSTTSQYDYTFTFNVILEK